MRADTVRSVMLYKIMLKNEILKNNTNTDLVRRIADAAFLVLAGLYIYGADITKSTLRLNLPDNWKKGLIVVLAAAAVARLAVMLAKDAEGRTKWIRLIAMAACADVIYGLAYLANRNTAGLFLAVLTIGMIGLEYEKLLKTYVIAASAVIFPAIVLAWIGAIDNFVYVRDMTIRSSWGIKYPTDLMSLLFFLCLAVWVLTRKKSDLWMLIPGGIMLLMSVCIANSRTGAMCDAAFILIVCLNYYLTRREPARFNKFIETCSCVSFPFFTIVATGLLFAYRRGYSFAVRANVMMSNRLLETNNVLNEYGFGLLGRKIPQIGNGGTVFARAEYSFVDISYNVLLIQYGILALILVNILWVLMTRKAFRIGDRRLGLALALVAFNCLSEHHIMQINYNIFIALPFAVLGAGAYATAGETLADAVGTGDAARGEAPARTGRLFGGFAKESLGKAAMLVILAIVTVSAVLMMLPKARTVISLIDTEEEYTGRRLLYLLVLIGLLIVATGVCSIFKLGCSLIDRITINRKPYIAVVVCCIVCVCAVMLGSDLIINKGAERKANLIDSERPVIEIVQKAQIGKLYVAGLPAVYDKLCGGISSSLFNGEELARYDNASVIMKKKLDSPCFFNTGFLYTPISDSHALFTNDAAVIKALQKEGYHLTGYYPLKKTVKLKKQAKKNGLELSEAGTIRLEGEKNALLEGPDADLREGRYTFTIEMAADTKASTDQTNDDACTIQITYNKGKYIGTEVDIPNARFDKDGNCVSEVICELPDAEDTDIRILPIGDNVIDVKSIAYQKTPERDEHSFYDSNRVKIREEYYDLEGEPDTGNWGYFAKEIGYDSKGNINHEIYYDVNGDKTLNADGYCEIKKQFGDIGNVLLEEYYGTDGKRITLPQGQSATAFTYDSFGHVITIAYFDTNDEPVMVGGTNWGGYQQVKRAYDDKGRIISEGYCDEEGNPVMIVAGYATRQTSYNDEDNKLTETYLDQNNNKVTIPEGYCEVIRVFNETYQVINEKYYDIDGKTIELPSGNAETRFSYDEKGRLTEVTYYNLKGEPVDVGGEAWGPYQKVIKTYDENNRVIREMYLDRNGHLSMLKDGYASREPIYDKDNKVTGYLYYDANGNEVFPDR